ncbi:MAG: hypothetical protein ACLFQG_06335 [Desulfovermiculus sp.]
MNDFFVQYVPALAFFAHLTAFVAYVFKRRQAGRRWTWTGFFLLAGMAFVNWNTVHRLPVYSLYETSLHAALVLALCLIVSGKIQRTNAVLKWGNLLVAGLLGLALPVLGQFNHDFYMYQIAPVQLFFVLRITAGGILLYSFLLFASAWQQQLENQRNNGMDLLRSAKSVLVLAATVYLGSEFSGTVWCLLGWGDTWHWSSNFFQSTAIFLLLMLPLHIPPGWKKTGCRSATGSLCTLTAALAIMLP